MRVALIQQAAGTDRSENRARGMQAARKAASQGAQVIAYAELAFDRFYPQCPATADELALAERVDEETVPQFQALAAELGVVFVLNLFERDGEHTYDSSPVIDADGTLLGITRMIHITEYEHFHEQGYYHPGDKGAPVFDTRFGKVGVAICYDRHFPEYMRALALGGAEVVFVPQAGAVDEWPDGLYQAEMQVAAFQNGYFTALCNRVGQEDALDFAGESFVCNPHGKVIAQAESGVEETLLADLDLSLVPQSHARRLFFQHRRPQLYAEWFRA